MNRFGILIAVLMTFGSLSSSATADDQPQQKSNDYKAASVDARGGQVPVTLVGYRRCYRRNYYGHSRPYYRYYGRSYYGGYQPYLDFRPYNRYYGPSNLYRPYSHAPYFPYYQGF